MSALASLETWLTTEAAKIKAGLPAFESAVVNDFDTAKAAVEAYAGVFAASLVEVAKHLNPGDLQAFATAMLPFIETKIVAGLAAISITGTAATAFASQAASAVVTSIVTAVTAVTAAVVVPK